MRLMKRQVMAWVYWKGMLLGWLYVVLSDAGPDTWDQFITHLLPITKVCQRLRSLWPVTWEPAIT